MKNFPFFLAAQQFVKCTSKATKNITSEPGYKNRSLAQMNGHREIESSTTTTRLFPLYLSSKKGATRILKGESAFQKKKLYINNKKGYRVDNRRRLAWFFNIAEKRKARGAEAC